MSVTAAQWAQAEAERQRQVDLVQTLINDVRRLGTEQWNKLQEIQRLRAEQLLPTPPVSSRGSQAAEQSPPAPPAGRGIIDTRIGKPASDYRRREHTWGEWSFKLRSYVSVVDLQTRPNDGRSRAGRTADHPTTVEWSTGIPRPCSNAQSAFASTFPGIASRADAFRFWARASWCHISTDCV